MRDEFRILLRNIHIWSGGLECPDSKNMERQSYTALCCLHAHAHEHTHLCLCGFLWYLTTVFLARHWD